MLNEQLEDNDVIIFPIDFLHQILTGDIQAVADKALKTYLQFLWSHLIILPVIAKIKFQSSLW